MRRYLLKRLLEIIPNTFGILLLCFALFHLVGGSPAEAILGQHATAESIAAFNRKYGYDKPLIFSADSQFVHYLGSLARGDFGVSTESGLPVLQVLKNGVGASLSLTVPILLLGVLAGLPLALWCAARRQGRADRAVLLGSTVLMSVNYVIWIILGQYLLAFRLKLFPVWGFEHLGFLLLPVLIGTFSGLGRDVRFYRAALLDEIYKPYVRTATAKGLHPLTILLRHVLPNALIPILTYISQSIPFLFTGSLLLESFFGIPGLGSVSLNAIHSSDMAVVRAVVIIGALLYQFVNLATDLLYARLDPRVRLT
ncbi:MAG: ABC transporter permease [Kiritimatiellia bacterium]|nr:ABC transporter permease [Kiritimatiellia bacterium]